jgi:chemotaxis signal transduction protein
MRGMRAGSPPAESKALLFRAGGLDLALRLAHVREILAVGAGDTDVVVRGESVPALPVAVALGLPAGPARFAIATEAVPSCALLVEAVHGIVDLAATEVFQLPARTVLPEPPPFDGVLVHRGKMALELAVATLGWVPIEPALDGAAPPPERDFAPERELLFTRAGRTYAVPLQLVAQVLDAPTVFPVPLTPPAHRGILYHGRAIHPVFDLAVLFRHGDGAGGSTALLVDAGGIAVAVLADRILGAGEAARADVSRPSWDLLFAD